MRELAESPTREDLLQPAVEHPRREPRVELGPELALRLPALDDAPDDEEGLADLVDLPLQVRAAGDLADHHAHEVGIGTPGAKQDLRHALDLLLRRRARSLDLPERLDEDA